MRAHFFDIDVILNLENKVWIVDTEKPNIPILKITKSDFNLITSGIFKSQGNLIKFNSQEYWLPTELFNKLKLKFKSYKSNFSNLGFSLQEFLNKDLIENLDYEIYLNNVSHVINTDDHIYVICSRNSKRNYDLLITKFEDLLKQKGISVKKFYFISETFFNRNDDEISYRKIRLLLQHLVGFKTENNKFTDESIEQYDEIFYYDDNKYSVDLAKNVNTLLHSLLLNTEVEIKEMIKKIIKNREIVLSVNLSTHNKVNKFVSDKVILEYNNIVKTFESFGFNPFYPY